MYSLVASLCSSFGGKLFHHILHFLSENMWLGGEVPCDPVGAGTGARTGVRTGSSHVLSQPGVGPADHTCHNRKLHQIVRSRGDTRNNSALCDIPGCSPPPLQMRPAPSSQGTPLYHTSLADRYRTMQQPPHHLELLPDGCDN